jgi:hypothetical protein
MYSGKQYTLNHEQGDMNNMTKSKENSTQEENIAIVDKMIELIEKW